MAEQFFIIGAQRSGTSYLYRLLDEHPDIQMAKPLRPEPKFFLRSDTIHLKRADYEGQYYTASTARFHGEKSTSYIESPRTARRIAKMYPRALILAILREPAERAISNYRFSVDHGVESLELWEALNRTAKEIASYDHSRFSVSPWTYIERGNYAKYLEPWREFPLHIELFENLIADSRTISRILKFLGAEIFEPPSLGKVVNASSQRADLDPDQWKELKGRFRASNAALEREYGLDLSPWKV